MFSYKNKLDKKAEAKSVKRFASAFVSLKMAASGIVQVLPQSAS